MLTFQQLPPDMQKTLAAMTPEMQRLVLEETLSFVDLARVADVRLCIEIATYGPGYILVNARARLQESVMWRHTFDPATDALIPPPAEKVSGIVPATAEQATEIVKAVSRSSRK